MTYGTLHNYVKENLPENATFDDYYHAVIQKMGGPKALRQFLPEPIDAIREKFKEDPDLNSIPLNAWDRAAGIREIPAQPPRYTRDPSHPFQQLIYNTFRTSVSPSECACILKEAAAMLCKGRK